MATFLILLVFASCTTTLAFLHPILDLRSSYNDCANVGCSRAGSIGRSCFRPVGNVEDYDTWNDSPENAKVVRDCICGSLYWSHMTQCRDCLINKNLYPTDVLNIITPVSAMSTSFCSLDGGRTNTKTIDGWLDANTYGVDNINRLETITTVPTDGPSPNTGIGGDAVETVIAETVFDSIISAASTETGLVSAISSASTIAGPSASPTPQASSLRSTVSSTTTGGGNPNTSLRSTSSLSMNSDPTLSTTASSANTTGSEGSTSNSRITASIHLGPCIITWLFVCFYTL
ncbi:MAG: hypothetical protein Q9209_005428 [Squamulea sp. 1 TL-2023]